MLSDNLKKLQHTYCNPLPIPNIPRGKDDWYCYEHGMFSHENKPQEVTCPDYRSISDPTVFYWDNKWYLYPSYGMAWVSEDFQNWKHVRTEPYCPKYSPCITPWNEKFLLTSWCCPLYAGDTPVGPFYLLGDFLDIEGNEFCPCDPAIFTDDDGRIYLYAFDSEPETSKFLICGYELDRTDPRRVIRGPFTIISMDPVQKPWERHGRYHQNKKYGWVEGPHMLKHNGRYYMIYAAPDTCDTSYCMAVYYSDSDPLSGFVCQKRNPLTFHEGGLITGAGHGCVEHGPDGSLWAFYTIATPYIHRFERRIGMDRVEVDDNGELYCPKGVTDTPQPIPGITPQQLTECDCTDVVSLTAAVRPEASSSEPGREALYATDESNISYWLPEKVDPMPTLDCLLDGDFEVSAVRIFWREIGLDYENGIIPAPVCYLLEGYDGERWFELLDMRCNTEEYNIDYRTFATKICSRVRLSITGIPEGLRIGVIDFSLFGKMPE